MTMKVVHHVDLWALELQKIVLKVQMNCDKCRTKALKVVADADGVDHFGFEAEKEQVVVMGDGVDVANLAIRLRKKLGYADVISVALVN